MIKPNSSGQPVFDKSYQKAFWKEPVEKKKWYWLNWIAIWKRMKLDPYQWSKVNSNVITVLNLKAKMPRET